MQRLRWTASSYDPRGVEFGGRVPCQPTVKYGEVPIPVEPQRRGDVMSVGKWAVVVCALAPAVASAAHAQQSLETETARTLPAGRVVIGQNLEFQTSGDGTELALPFSAEVGITNRFEFLVEPVPYTTIRPAAGTRATGWGDLEVTLTYLVARETT